MADLELVIERPQFADYQRAFLYCEKRFSAVEASTKSGKTYSHIFWLFEEAHNVVRYGDEYWWIAPTLEQAAIAFDTLYRFMLKRDILDLYQVSRNPMVITTPEGGVLRFKTGERPDHLFGPSNVRAVVVDEFTRCRLEVWDAARSLVTATGGPIKMIGNYKGDDTEWHRWIERQLDADDSELAYFKVTAEDAVRAGIMDPEEVRSAERTLPHSVFQALYMCRGVADRSMLVTYDAVQDLWTNEHAMGGESYIVADVARYGSDRTVVGLWEGYRWVHATVMAKSGVDETCATIKQLAVQERVPMSRVLVDEDGVGGGVVDFLKCRSFRGGQTKDTENYDNLRSLCLFRLASMINSREVYLGEQLHPWREDIEQELVHIRMGDETRAGKLTAVRKEVVKEKLRRSPDFLDVAMMRMAMDMVAAPKVLESLERAANKRRVRFKDAGGKPRNIFGGR